MEGHASGTIYIPNPHKLVFGEGSGTDVSINESSDGVATITGSIAFAPVAGSTALTLTGPAASSANPFVYINDATRTAAGGGRVLRIFGQQSATALTGTLEAVYARAENDVASMTGKLVGVSGYAANTAASAGGTIHGGEFWALTKGANCGTVRGMEVGIDSDGGESITDAVGIRVTMQAVGATNCYGLQIVDDSATNAGGTPLDAFIRCEESSAGAAPGSIIDAAGVVGYASAVNGITLTAGDVPLFSYKDKDGTAHVVVCADNDSVAVRT